MINMALAGILSQSAGIRPNYIYGLLYNFWAATDSRIGNSGFAPATQAQWFALFVYVNTNYNLAPNNFGITNHLKSCRQVSSPLGGECSTSVHPRWNAHATHYGRNTLKFGFFGGGVRTSTFAQIGVRGYVYGDAISEVSANYYMFRVDTNSITLLNIGKTTGLSVRLCKTASPDELLLPEGVIQPNYYKGNNNFLYDCVRIDTLLWVVPNLAETKFNDGTLIPSAGINGVNYSDAEWTALTNPAFTAYLNLPNTWAYTL